LHQKYLNHLLNAKQCGVSGGDRVSPAPLGWYFLSFSHNSFCTCQYFGLEGDANCWLEKSEDYDNFKQILTLRPLSLFIIN